MTPLSCDPTPPPQTDQPSPVCDCAEGGTASPPRARTDPCPACRSQRRPPIQPESSVFSANHLELTRSTLPSYKSHDVLPCRTVGRVDSPGNAGWREWSVRCISLHACHLCSHSLTQPFVLVLPVIAPRVLDAIGPASWTSPNAQSLVAQCDLMNIQHMLCSLSTSGPARPLHALPLHLLHRRSPSATRPPPSPSRRNQSTAPSAPPCSQLGRGAGSPRPRAPGRARPPARSAALESGRSESGRVRAR